MPLRFKFDRVDGSRVHNTISGFEIVRRCTVYDLPVESLATSYMALMRIIRDPQCPQCGTNFPDPTVPATLVDQLLVSVEKPKRRVEVDLLYRSAAPLAGGGGGAIAWAVEDSPQVSWVQTNQTAGGKKPLKIWYKQGEADITTTQPAGADFHGGLATKPLVDRELRVTGRATLQQWVAYRAKVRGAAGRVNKTRWGTYDRGTCLFLGPHTRTVDRGNSFDILLSFLIRELGWWSILFFRDRFGNIPSDVVSESFMRQSILPPEGDMVTRNGLTMASQISEVDFNAFFEFNPDMAPTPG